jgi:hypothetical protein
MKFRILTNGKCFRIQRKGWIRWRWVGQLHIGYDGGGYLHPFEFASDASAVDLIRFKYGAEAEIERPWYPSHPARSAPEPKATGPTSSSHPPLPGGLTP